MSAYIPVDLQRRVRERFSNCCAYFRCAEELTVSTFEFEHVVPRSAGGLTNFENICLACPTCNRCKGDRQAALDPATGQLIPLFRPPRDAWSDHFAWSDDATEIIALTVIGRATISALRMNRPQLLRVRRMWFAMGLHPPATDQGERPPLPSGL